MIAASLDLSALTAAAQRAVEAASDWSEPFEPMGELVREDYAAKFARGGPGWPKPAAGNKPGVKTGALERSYVQLGAPGNVADVGRTEARFGSDLPYAEDFQQRAAVAREPGPALRRDLTAEARDHMAAAFEDLP